MDVMDWKSTANKILESVAKSETALGNIIYNLSYDGDPSPVALDNMLRWMSIIETNMSYTQYIIKKYIKSSFYSEKEN